MGIMQNVDKTAVWDEMLLASLYCKILMQALVTCTKKFMSMCYG